MEPRFRVNREYIGGSLAELRAESREDPEFVHAEIVYNNLQLIRAELRGMYQATGLSLDEFRIKLGLDESEGAQLEEFLRENSSIALTVAMLFHFVHVCGGDTKILIRQRNERGEVVREVSVGSLSKED